MGRRSINTTKSGKYMNPTDQARKEARKRELKKNKKQRIAVRQAVLKSKDALQLLEEASMYDKQEYTPSIQSTLNERVLQGKRKRLLETFDNLVNLYVSLFFITFLFRLEKRRSGLCQRIASSTEGIRQTSSWYDALSW